MVVGSAMDYQGKGMGPGLLHGVRVLDLSDVVAGPVSTLYLAMLGAEVIKVENPKRSGDINRASNPIQNGCSVRFCTLNHNKKSVAIDLSTKEGRQLVLKLVGKSDVVMENFRNGVMDRLGLGFSELKKANPRIVYGHISGFGSTGPYKDLPAYDAIAQAMSGIMMMNGEENGPPVKIGTSIGDVIAGMDLAIGVLAALREADRTGEAQHVEVALVDAMIASMMMDNITYLYDQKLPVRTGNRYREWSPYGIYPAKDGYYALGIGTEKFYQTLVRDILHHPELLEDERCSSHNARILHRDLTETILNEWAGEHTVKEVCDILNAHGIPNAKVNTIADVFQDPHFSEARNMFPTYRQPEIGDIRVTNQPIRLIGREEVPFRPAPRLGQDADEVFRGLLDMSEEDIARLRADGIVI